MFVCWWWITFGDSAPHTGKAQFLSRAARSKQYGTVWLPGVGSTALTGDAMLRWVRQPKWVNRNPANLPTSTAHETRPSTAEGLKAALYTDEKKGYPKLPLFKPDWTTGTISQCMPDRHSAPGLDSNSIQFKR